MTRTTTDLRLAVEGLYKFQHPFHEDGEDSWMVARAAVLLLIPEGDEPVYLVTASELAAVRKALVIGAISHEGDGWYAEDAGYPDAEADITAAFDVLSRLGGEE